MSKKIPPETMEIEEYFAQINRKNKAFVSYANNNEDVLLNRIFFGTPSGRFLDIGSGHPIEGSLTYALSERGWTGVACDPGNYSSLYEKYRKNTEFFNVGVGIPGNRTYLVNPQDLGMNKFSELPLSEEGWESSTKLVLSFNEILQMSNFANITHFNLLAIDVEGLESEIIQQINFDVYSFDVLVIESIKPWSAIKNNTWLKLLTGKDYVQIGFDGVNSYFSKNTNFAKLLNYPVCALDHFQDYNAVKLIGQIEKLNKEVEFLNKKTEENVILLENFSNSHQKEIANLQSQITKLISSLNEKTEELHILKNSKLMRLINLIRNKYPSLIKLLLNVYNLLIPIISHKHKKHFLHPIFNIRTPKLMLEWMIKIKLLRKGFGFKIKSTQITKILDILLDEIDNYQGPSDIDLAKNIGNKSIENKEYLNKTIQFALFVDSDSSDIEQKKNNERLRLLIDARALQRDDLANRGVGQINRNLINILTKTKFTNEVTLLYTKERKLPEYTNTFLYVEDLHTKEISNFDIFVNLSPLTNVLVDLLPIFKVSGLKKIAIVYDFIPLHFPKNYLKKSDLKLDYFAKIYSLQKYDHICVFSKPVAEEFSILFDKMNVNQIKWEESDSRVPTGNFNKRNQILIVGGDDLRKNNLLTLIAIKEIVKSSDLEVKILGFSKLDENFGRRRLGLGEQVTFYEHISTIERDELYSKSKLVICSSFDEGLSLPPLEAIKAGTPCVMSDIAVHKSLFGKGNWYFNPLNVKQMRAKIEFGLLNADLILKNQVDAIRNSISGCKEIDDFIYKT